MLETIVNRPLPTRSFDERIRYSLSSAEAKFSYDVALARSQMAALRDDFTLLLHSDPAALSYHTYENPAFSLLQASTTIAKTLSDLDIQYAIWCTEHEALPSRFIQTDDPRTAFDAIGLRWNPHNTHRVPIHAQFDGALIAPDIAIASLLLDSKEVHGIRDTFTHLSWETLPDPHEYKIYLNDSVSIILTMQRPPQRDAKNPLKHTETLYHLELEITDSKQLGFEQRQRETLQQIEITNLIPQIDRKQLIAYILNKDPNASHSTVYITFPCRYLSTQRGIAAIENVVATQADSRFTVRTEGGEHGRSIKLAISPTQEYQDARRRAMRTEISQKLPRRLRDILSHSTVDTPFLYQDSSSPQLAPTLSLKRKIANRWIGYPRVMVDQMVGFHFPAPEQVKIASSQYRRSDTVGAEHFFSTFAPNDGKPPIQLAWKLQLANKGTKHESLSIVCWAIPKENSLL